MIDFAARLFASANLLDLAAYSKFFIASSSLMLERSKATQYAGDDAEPSEITIANRCPHMCERSLTYVFHITASLWARRRY